MRVTVIGSGYVGLVAAACFAEIGHDVVCVDKDVEKIAMLRRGECPIHEAHLPELLKKHLGKQVSFTSDLPGAAESTEVLFIAVGTPPMLSGKLDLSQVEAVARELGPLLKDGYRLVVCKSTTPPGSAKWIRRILLLNGAQAESFDVACNPEFLREGTAVTDFLFPDRIVAGADCERASRTLEAIYRPLTSGEYYSRAHRVDGTSHGEKALYIPTSTVSAELIKNAANAYLAMKISFINAVANVCENAGGDVEEVRRGVGADRRIGDRFLNPGIGYGGSCFPKDVSAFHELAHSTGYDFPLLHEVSKINNDQQGVFVGKVQQALWTLPGKRLAALGLSYKGGTDDIRESPAIGILQRLLAEGCSVKAYDPAAMERAKPVFSGKAVQFASDPYDAVAESDALLILTDWKDFRKLDLARIRSGLRYPIVIDGRNMLDPKEVADAGLFYYSMGRRHLAPHALFDDEEERASAEAGDSCARVRVRE